MSPFDLNALTDEQIDALALQLKDRIGQWQLLNYFPEDGPLSRHNYPKHMAFFDAGVVHRERLFMAGNRVGKSETGAYETTLHATGRYPHWWTGKRFDEAGEGWAAGSTLETMRDIVQAKLLGPDVDNPGNGMIPYDDIVDIKKRPNGNGALDYVDVKRQTGTQVSRIGFKSYDQGRKNFEGTAKHFVWLDEEPPPKIYTECVTRTATTRGIVLVTFTPLNGATQVVREFMNKAALRV